MSVDDRRCGNCEHFRQRETVVNAMRLFGKEKVEIRTYCMWTPPIPYWAASHHIPEGMTETRARAKSEDDGRFCAAFLQKTEPGA
jgi:hypothetical protein